MSLKEFVKIAVGLREHPKVLEAGDDAGWLFVCSLMWSKEHDTDGLIPNYAVTRLNGLSGRRLTAAVHKACTVGLWHRTDSGFLIHDYSDYQESSEKRKAAAKKAADARWGAKDPMRSASESHTERNANGNANAMRNRNAEKEEEKEEEIPPSPPQGGRAREKLEYELKFNAWVAENFPGIQPALVEFFCGRLRGRGIQPTVSVLRALLDEHDAKNKTAREQLETERRNAA